MFADVALATRIDGAEARLSIAVGSVVAGASIAPLDGGAAVVGRLGSPINKVIGIGLAGVPDEPSFAAVEEVWRGRGEPVRVELSTLADPAVGAWLTGRGYRLHGFENVLIRELGAGDAEVAEAPVIAIDRDPDRRTWLEILVEGFVDGDGTGAVADQPAHDAVDAVMRDLVDAEGFVRYLAHLDGAVAGGASLRVDGGVALLCGAATLARHRRRGVQAALLHGRLADARRAGCDVAVVTTAPGSISQRNVERHGFRLGYARAVLVRAWG